MSTMTTTTTPTNKEDSDEPSPPQAPVVYSLPGSQFTAKVLAALQHRKIPHYVQNVPFNKKARTKMIPSGGYLVPEIKIGTGDDAVIVSDSEKILHWMDQHYPEANLFPNELASQLSVRASETKLAASVWYYNWVDQSGYERSIRKATRRVLPWWLSPVVPNFLLDIPLASERRKFRQQTCQAIGVVNNNNNNDKELDNEPKIRQILMDELQFFQSHLQTTANQRYLVPGTSQPTAADFSVYVQLERLVGGGSDGTGAYDVALEPALPQLLQEKSLQLLWGWHKRMQEACPVQFRGKKPPKELLA